jgi:hypothetical protein
MPWLAIKLFLSGMMKRLLGLMAKLWELTCKYPLQVALVAALVLSGWLWRGNVSRDRTIASMKAQHKNELAERDAASEANRALAYAQVAALQAKYNAQAKENAYVEKALRADLGARAATNADRMRFDKVCRREPAPAREDSPAPVDHGPGPDAVILERRDYDTLIDNTVRLKAANAWGDALIAEGLAVKASELPEPSF